jgi:hypothetical protein
MVLLLPSKQHVLTALKNAVVTVQVVNICFYKISGGVYGRLWTIFDRGIWSKGLLRSEIGVGSANLWSPEESLMRQPLKQEKFLWQNVEELVKLFRTRRRKVRCCVTKWRNAAITAMTSVASIWQGACELIEINVIKIIHTIYSR